MQTVIQRILNLSKPSHQAQQYFLLPTQNSPRIPILEKYFEPLPSGILKPITFIDGGTGTLFSSPQLWISFHRLCAITFNNGKKSIQLQEFFTFIEPKKHKEEIIMTIEFDPPWIEPLTVDSHHPEFRVGMNRVELSSLANYALRIAELRFAMQFESVALDGSLRCLTKEEEKIMEMLPLNTCAVAKTCSWLTNEAEGCITALLAHTKQDTWQYPIVLPATNIIFAKLHTRSKHVVKIESKKGFDECISLLLPFTSDASFFGYPCGLTLADRLARVKHNEEKILATKLLSLLPKDSIQAWKHSLDAHTVLDSLM